MERPIEKVTRIFLACWKCPVLKKSAKSPCVFKGRWNRRREILTWISIIDEFIYSRFHLFLVSWFMDPYIPFSICNLGIQAWCRPNIWMTIHIIPYHCPYYWSWWHFKFKIWGGLPVLGLTIDSPCLTVIGTRIAIAKQCSHKTQHHVTMPLSNSSSSSPQVLSLSKDCVGC